MNVKKLNDAFLLNPSATDFRGTSISVAIATYNGERYLRDLLVSILKQSVPPCEIVFADDYSSDKTVSIIHKFAETAPFPVTLILQERNVGVIQNYLSAFQYCSGDAVAYCDQDDVWLSDKIEKCAAPFADSGVNLVIHRSFITDAELHKSGRIVHYNKYAGRLKFPVNSLDITGYGHQMVFRKSVVEALLVLRENLADELQGIIDNFDGAIPLAASLFGDIVILPEPLVLFRRHGESVSPAEKTHLDTSVAALVARRFATNRIRTENVAAFLRGLSQHPSALAHVMTDLNSYVRMLNNVKKIGYIRCEMEDQERVYPRLISLLRLWACALTARPGGNLYAYKDFIADMICTMIGGGNRSGTSGV